MSMALQKGEALIICQSSISFFSSSLCSSSSTSFFSSCSCTASSPSCRRRRGRPQFYRVPWRTRLIVGLTSRSSSDLIKTASPPEESPEDGAVEDAGVGLLDLVESSLLGSCQCGFMLLPLGSKARTETVLSPSKRQQSMSPSCKFKLRENKPQPEPRKIKRELSTSKST